jgi:hypothetical protein
MPLARRAEMIQRRGVKRCQIPLLNMPRFCEHMIGRMKKNDRAATLVTTGQPWFGLSYTSYRSHFGLKIGSSCISRLHHHFPSNHQNQQFRTYSKLLPFRLNNSPFPRHAIRDGTITTCENTPSENSRLMGGQLSTKMSCIHDDLKTEKMCRRRPADTLTQRPEFGQLHLQALLCQNPQ